MRFINVLRCPENNGIAFSFLLCYAVLSCLILIANPGFFSHDELQIADFVTRNGFWNFVSAYGMFHPTDHFGVPVRPVSFFIQGVASLFLPNYPFLVHFADVLMHSVVAMLLFEAIRRVHGNRQFAWAAAVIFLISPLATFSVGWSAALMDRLYILFGLIAFIASHTYISQKCDSGALIILFTASSLAILSKETALILPAMLVVFPLFLLVDLKNRRLWIALAVWGIPVLLFLLYRAPALMHSLGSAAATQYSVSIANVPQNIFVYAIYPFLTSVTEAHLWVLQPSGMLWSAVAAQVAILALLWRVFSFRTLLAYFVCYLIFLIPILPIVAKGAHYLYGSALVMSIALAALITLKWKRGHRTLLAIPIALLVVFTAHTLNIQIYFYDTGMCMSRAASTIESTYLSDGRPKEMVILVESQSPGHVLQRFVVGKESIGTYSPVKFRVVDWGQRNEAEAVYGFNASCVVYRLSSVDLRARNSVRAIVPTNAFSSQQRT